MRSIPSLLLVLTLATLVGCKQKEVGGDPPSASIYAAANGCFVVEASDPGQGPAWLATSSSGEAFDFVPAAGAGATPFFLKASGLGRYLFYDDGGSYLVSDGSALLRQAELLSDVLLVDDDFQSEAEWALEHSIREPGRFQLRHVESGRYLATTGLQDGAADAASVALNAAAGCAEFPEIGTNTEGRVTTKTFKDGTLFGFVDTHSHILSNFAFGGGGIFHGAAFHPLGVEHALADCETYHGVEGRKDLFGYVFDGGLDDIDLVALILALATGETPGPNHATAGWPDFTEWPDAVHRSTHQMQYYKWIERAYLGGLRLVVQHATTNEEICNLLALGGIQPVRYACEDMVAVDRIIDETYAMQDYIDAQSGGPGKGWFQIATSPEKARRLISKGKMAVVLGIEASDLFDCYLVPPEGVEGCNEQDVLDRLDAYHARGVRALFPVHKYDNGFPAGDGHRGFIELRNMVHTGHFGNFVTDCPDLAQKGFDSGPEMFSGLNAPRDDYFGEPPYDFSNLPLDPVGTLLPFLGLVIEPPGPAPACQNAGMTALGEFLMHEMMKRGMIIEVDHLPQRSYVRAFEILEANDYPAAGTHGRNNDGRLYALGGVSKSGFGRCRNPAQPGTVDDGFQARIQLIEAMGGYPAEGFGLDLNGFAGAPGPRFGPESGCSDQTDPLTYPFQSYGGDVTFHQPTLGNRTIDFNTEGLAHIGLLPDLIEDVRRDGVSDEALEPLFKSAEAYIRMWEKAERRAAEMAATP